MVKTSTVILSVLTVAKDGSTKIVQDVLKTSLHIYIFALFSTFMMI